MAKNACLKSFSDLENGSIHKTGYKDQCQEGPVGDPKVMEGGKTECNNNYTGPISKKTFASKKAEGFFL